MGEELLGIIPSKKSMHAIDRFKAEQELSEKFGDEALKLYMMIDGKKNAEEIRSATGMEESKFLEILGYLEDKKLIFSKTVFEAELEHEKEEKG